MANPTTLVEQFNGSLGVFTVSGTEQYDGGLWLEGPPAYSDVILATSGLVGYWRLGEPSGTTAADAVGDNDGTTSGATVNQTGLIFDDADTAYSFDGSNDRVSIPFDAALNPSVFTAECWVLPTNVVGHRSPLSNRDANPVALGHIFYIEPSGQWQMWWGIGLGGGWVGNEPLLGAASTVAPTYLAMTYDGSVGRAYINGSLVRTTDPFTYAPNTSAPMTIGAGANDESGDFWWQGKVDEVAIYDVALDDATIGEHYDAGVGALAGSSASVATTGIITPDAGSLAFRNTRKIDTGAEEIILTVGTVGAATDAMRIGYDATDHPFMEFNSNGAGWQRVTATATVAATVEALLYFDWTGTTMQVSVDNGALDSDTRDAVENDWGAGDLILGSG